MASQRVYRIRPAQWIASTSPQLEAITDPDVRRWCMWALGQLDAGRVHPPWRADEYRARIAEALRRQQS